eukprot:2503589-Prymnesium_polylepis.2
MAVRQWRGDKSSPPCASRRCITHQQDFTLNSLNRDCAAGAEGAAADHDLGRMRLTWSLYWPGAKPAGSACTDILVTEKGRGQNALASQLSRTCVGS